MCNLFHGPRAKFDVIWWWTSCTPGTSCKHRWDSIMFTASIMCWEETLTKELSHWEQCICSRWGSKRVAQRPWVPIPWSSDLSPHQCSLCGSPPLCSHWCHHTYPLSVLSQCPSSSPEMHLHGLIFHLLEIPGVGVSSSSCSPIPCLNWSQTPGPYISSPNLHHTLRWWHRQDGKPCLLACWASTLLVMTPAPTPVLLASHWQYGPCPLLPFSQFGTYKSILILVPSDKFCP